jgi:hypothetical protein
MVDENHSNMDVAITESVSMPRFGSVWGIADFCYLHFRRSDTLLTPASNRACVRQFYFPLGLTIERSIHTYVFDMIVDYTMSIDGIVRCIRTDTCFDDSSHDQRC